MFSFSPEKKYYIFGVLVTLILFILSQTPVMHKFDRLFWDGLQQVYQTPVRDDITIVGIDDQSLGEIGAWPWSRKIFSELLSQLEHDGARVVGIDVTFFESRSGDDSLQTWIDTHDLPVVLASKISDEVHMHPIFSGTHVGFTNVLQDNDGIVRSLLRYLPSQEDTVSFPEEIYRSYISDHPRKEALYAWNAALPDQTQFIYGAESFTQISVNDLLAGNYDVQDIKDHIIIIGSTAKDLRTGLVDNVSRVGGIRIPGVTLHAYMVSALLNKQVLHDISFPILFTLFFVLGLVLLYVFYRTHKWWIDLLVVLVSSGILLVLSIILFDKGILFPTITFIWSMIMLLIYQLVMRYIEERQSRQFLAKAFAQYMNPQLLDTLIKHPELLQLGGTKKEMTILFSDIRSFTTLSESLSAEELVTLLNAYLDKMSHIIFDHEGVIDKFIGDAIMAFWNSPITDTEHALHAVYTAIAMTEALTDFNTAQKGPDLQIGIGVHTGEVVVGNMGSTKRFDFTVIGDNVNLAARLEGLTKKYGVSILLSEDTVKQIGTISGYLLRKVDEVVVKGKTLPITIYEPVEDTFDGQQKVSLYAKAFTAYQKGHMEEAKTVLLQLPEDKTSQLLLERINALDPLPSDWNGIWKWTEK